MSEFLGIPERIEVAIDYLIQSNEKISISKVCKIAEVNRSNIYVTYPDLVAKILSMRPDSNCTSKAKKRRSKLKPVHAVSNDVAALSYACIELRFALDEALQENKYLKEELAEARAVINRGTKSRPASRKPP